MESVSHHGRHTAYRTCTDGDGPTVCYVHCAGGDHIMWAYQYGDSNGPPAVAVDLTGHGRSDDVDVVSGEETLDAYADDVVAVCEATDATVLCGHSMGGAVALWTILERDVDFEAAIFVSTGARLVVDPGILEAMETNFEAAVESLHQPGVLFADPNAASVEATQRGMIETGRAVTVRDFETCDGFDVSDRLDDIAVPSLAVCGERDRLTPPRLHHQLAETLPGCRVVELPGAAHVPMLERPERFGGELRSFLE